jgi:hypothetical protein
VAAAHIRGGRRCPGQVNRRRRWSTGGEGHHRSGEGGQSGRGGAEWGRRSEWGGLVWTCGGGIWGNKIIEKGKKLLTSGSQKKFTNKPKVDMSELRLATSALIVGPGQKSC